MQRAKTQKKRTQSSAQNAAAGGSDSPFAGGDTIVKATEDGLDAFFACESAATFQQPWQKLDRGSRLDRLRKFVASYPGMLTAAERAALLSAVLKAFELRQLNSKVAVEYDPVAAAITSIRGLKERVSSSGLKTYRIDPPTAPRARSTMKVVRGRAGASASTSGVDTLTGGSLEPNNPPPAE